MEYRRAPQPDDPLIVAFNSRVFALERATGDVRWEHALDSYGSASVALAMEDEHLYAASNATVTCIAHRSGEIVWSAPRRFNGRGPIVLQNDRLFVAAGGEIECFDLTGKRLWENGFAGKGYGALAMGFAGNLVQADVNT